jgi:hypothetical protein
MSVVESKSKSIMVENMKEIAKQKEEQNENVQLLIKKVKGKPEFFGLIDYKENIGHLPLDRLYPAWKDVFGVRSMIPMFIDSVIEDTAKEFKLNQGEINLIISSFEKDLRILNIHAYEQNKLLKSMNWSDVFGQNRLIKIMAKQ